MKLTKDDCYANDNGLLVACSDWEKTTEQILKNQEDAEKLQQFLEHNADYCIIVERLKKRIEELHGDYHFSEFEYGLQKELQKILGGDNN